MLEIIIEFLGEFLLQAIGEALIELGLHSLAEPLRQPPEPWLAALGYTIFGALFGGLSLLVFPSNLVPRPWRILNLLATPIAVGSIMTFMGAWRSRRGQSVLRIDHFAYGYVFALSFAVVRFLFAT